MKRLFILAIALFAVLTITSCASSTAGSDSGVNKLHQAPAITPQGRAAIETARSVGRVGLTIALQTEYHVPAEVTTLALSELDSVVINPALDGGAFALATDESAWKPVRDDMVKRATALLVKDATSKGVSLLDEATANVLVGQFIDAIAAQVKAMATPAATPAVTPTAEVVHG